MAKITACSTLVYTQSTLEEAIKKISARGFINVEIASLASYCKHFDEELTDVSHFNFLLRSAKLSPVALNYSTNRDDGYRYNLSVKTEADIVRKKMKTLLQKANGAGISLVNIGAGQRNDTSSSKNELINAALLVDEFAHEAKRYGIKLSLEVPHCWLLYNDLDNASIMFDHIKSDNVGVIMDSSHWHVVNYDIDEYMKRFGNRLCHVHLRDAAGTDTADFNQKLEITPGKGEVDFEKFGWYLDKYGYDSNVSIEFEYKNRSIQEIESEFDFGMKHLKKCKWTILTRDQTGGS